MILEKINSPKDIKALSVADLKILADEIRAEIISSTLENGGHMASSLGTVELILALHYVFDAPSDKLVFDVGHQAYAHKIITGRREEFKNLRKKDGLSGFPNHRESEFDVFDAGHASASISVSLGLARARDILGKNYDVVTVIGDGSISGGVAFEALNDLGDANTKMIIVLNDNEMSISKNVGGLSSHFSKIRTQSGYLKGKRRIKHALRKMNANALFDFAVHFRNTLRYLLIGETFFDSMGIKYLGPINGHDLEELIETFKSAKEQDEPIVIHTVTSKGLGYEQAQKNPEKFHGVSPQKNKKCESVSFAKQFALTMEELYLLDNTVCAITAGMPYNTGLSEFAKKHPKNFFDTGIAEQHALSLAGGLAKGGLKPFVVIYSTFMQRGFDQIFHDICLQEQDVTICVDHAGLAGEDGATHQGIYDLAFLRTMPNITILAARDSAQFDKMLKQSLKIKGPVAIRYPKGALKCIESTVDDVLLWDTLKDGKNGTVITFGANVEDALIIGNELDLSVIDARCIKPLDAKVLDNIVAKPIFVIEDNASSGGLCEAILHYYSQKNIKARVFGFALKDEFVSLGTVSQQREENCLDAQHIIEKIKNEIR